MRIIALFVFAFSGIGLVTAQAPATDPRTSVAPTPKPRPGDRFRDALKDGSNGPEMVVVPAGHFTMGSPYDESGRRRDEGPRHEVQLEAFSIGRTEVTRGEFAAFVKATGYLTDAERNTLIPGQERSDGCFAYADSYVPEWKPGSSWRKHGFEQDDNHPVACISWNDARAYTQWLSEQTRRPYRLPSEAELEYVIRAGSDTTWPWGSDEDAGCAVANGADIDGEKGMGERFGYLVEFGYAKSDCEDGYVFTAPVGRFAPNAMGLHDTIGNVYEWTQDCYRSSFASAPTDGSAYEWSDCKGRVLRGSAFSDEPVWLRSAVRIGNFPQIRYQNIGMRVARDL